MKPSIPSPIFIPKVLSIAGSDSGGGAGIQADLKVITALGGFGMTAVTAITAQNTMGVTRIQDIDLDVIEAQIDAVVTDIGVDVVKIGMLASPAIVKTVARCLKKYQIKRIVLDPVLRATSGASLGGDDTALTMVAELFPMAELITPNLHEASILLGRSIHETSQFKEAAEELLAMGPKAVLMKGGHLEGEPKELMDYLIWHDIKDDKPVVLQQAFVHPRIPTLNTHGTGCSLSSAIATYLADRHDLKHSVAKAISFVSAAIEAGQRLDIGKGPGPLWHMHDFYPTKLPEAD
ncbi:ThiD Hydroxymethylpyrimidine/phosphomethylpyrimidine kinase [Burkholderiaceae bacterium]